MLTELTHNLPQLYKTSHLTDVTLRLFPLPDQNSTGEPVLEIPLHRFVLFAAGLTPLQRMESGPFRESGSRELDLHLDCAQYSCDVLREFFGLLYMDRLAPSPQLDENLFHFHQLALFFQFGALERLCFTRLCALLSTETLPLILPYCLIPSGGGYTVPEERSALFEQVTRWLAWCAPPVLPPCEPLHALTPLGLLAELGQQPPTDGYVRRQCHECFWSRATQHRSHFLVDLGFWEEWSLCASFTGEDHHHRVTLYATRVPPQPPERSVRLRYSITLFSRLPSQAAVEGESALRAECLNLPNTLATLSLPHRRDCYDAVCDCCGDERPVYIFVINLRIG